MNVTSEQIIESSPQAAISKAISHCDSVMVNHVYDCMPAGELIKACDIKAGQMDDTGLMKCLTQLKQQGRVRTFKYKHYQLWGRVDEFTD